MLTAPPSQVFMLSNSQPFPASYKWVLAEGADPSVWSVTPASGQLGGPSTEEVTVRWNPKPNAPPGETEVSPGPLSPPPPLPPLHSLWIPPPPPSSPSLLLLCSEAIDWSLIFATGL